MTDLTEAQKKMLTEFLGECWHEDELFRCDDGSSFIRCKKCRRPLSRWEPFAFTSPDDRQALCEKLMERVEWAGFHTFVYERWLREPSIVSVDFTYYLLVEQPERFCKLVVAFWREGK
jgi:hypothetical protein